ncbi:hypothetical protein [Secundilactobacillus folii]|uniref:Uncharacterized protein n=1 Tax=Secundilactobacillus folii TaxID=2678357 RepID=A0A7X3C312_9LACO|nr:hypothetical protein [Secundilactobacillus folii]MTV82037.1 hypothetical protein [Secundilactobacillus folii]
MLSRTIKLGIITLLTEILYAGNLVAKNKRVVATFTKKQLMRGNQIKYHSSDSIYPKERLIYCQSISPRSPTVNLYAVKGV